MGILLSTGLEVISAAVVLIPIYLILNIAYWHSFKKCVFYLLFSFYLAAVYALVGMPTITYVRPELNLNLIPILGIILDLRSSILNVLLFLPLGIILPIGWQKFREKKRTLLFGFLMSLIIELLQIFVFRGTDINDLITNTLGTLLGFSVAHVLMKLIPTLKGVVNEKKTGEVYLVCAIVFGVMFFVQPFISSVLWDMVF